MAVLVHKIMSFLDVCVGWKFLRQTPVMLVCLSSGVIHTFFSHTVLDTIFSICASLPTVTSSKTFASFWHMATVPWHMLFKGRCHQFCNYRWDAIKAASSHSGTISMLAAGAWHCGLLNWSDTKGRIDLYTLQTIKREEMWLVDRFLF